MKTKTVKIALEGFGSYLGMEKGCFIIRDREGNTQKYPLFESEIDEIQLKSGNTVSTGALASCGFWGIDCLFLTQKGKPVAFLKSLDDDSHVRTRVSQYEALNNEKVVEIAKQFVLAKLEGQKQVLSKYGLKRHDFSVIEKVKNIEAEDTAKLRTRLMSIEGHCSERYFTQIFSLIPYSLRPDSRKTYRAYDGINNLFNLGYEILSWKVQYSLIKAKLEPYLGFLHSIEKGKPSLICDFQELYRYLLDDFIIEYCRNLHKQDFIVKNEVLSPNKKGKREYLNDLQTHHFIKNLNSLFQNKVKIPRMRIGEKQELETLINEEALLFAQYIRNEKPSWIPRIVTF
ncbi:MAG: CRISPR-associated endonuclease Cas1 [Candidatus Bathyarchaeia archaeon]|jgi:CRISPR-associated protein Cas1